MRFVFVKDDKKTIIKYYLLKKKLTIKTYLKLL